MPRYNIHATAKFNPYDFQEILQPMLLQTQWHNDAADKLATQQANAAAIWSSFKDSPNEGDRELYDQWAALNAQIVQAADNLAQRGLNSNPLDAARDFHKNYASTLAPYEAGIKARDAAVASQIQQQAANPDMMYADWYSNHSVKDFMNGQIPNITSAKGETIYNQAGQTAKAYSSRIFSSPKVKEIFNNMLLQTQITEGVPNNAKAFKLTAEYMDKEGDSQLKEMADNLREMYNYDAFGDTEKERFDTFMSKGFYDNLVGDVKYSTMQNPGYEKSSGATPDYLLDTQFWPTEIAQVDDPETYKVLQKLYGKLEDNQLSDDLKQKYNVQNLYEFGKSVNAETSLLQQLEQDLKTKQGIEIVRNHNPLSGTRYSISATLLPEEEKKLIQQIRSEHKLGTQSDAYIKATPWYIKSEQSILNNKIKANKSTIDLVQGKDRSLSIMKKDYDKFSSVTDLSQKDKQALSKAGISEEDFLSGKSPENLLKNVTLLRITTPTDSGRETAGNIKAALKDNLAISGVDIHRFDRQKGRKDSKGFRGAMQSEALSANEAKKVLDNLTDSFFVDPSSIKQGYITGITTDKDHYALSLRDINSALYNELMAPTTLVEMQMFTNPQEAPLNVLLAHYEAAEAKGDTQYATQLLNTIQSRITMNLNTNYSQLKSTTNANLQ